MAAMETPTAALVTADGSHGGAGGALAIDACSLGARDASWGVSNDELSNDSDGSAPRRFERNQARKVRQMRFSRRLSQALSEGTRAAVLRTALQQAKAAGCTENMLHSSILRRGETILPLVEDVEAAMADADVDRMRRVIEIARQGGAGEHVGPALALIAAIERRTESERALRTALDAHVAEDAASFERLELAVAEAEADGVEQSLVQRGEAILEAKRQRDRGMKARPVVPKPSAVEINANNGNGHAKEDECHEPAKAMTPPLSSPKVRAVAKCKKKIVRQVSKDVKVADEPDPEAPRRAAIAEALSALDTATKARSRELVDAAIKMARERDLLSTESVAEAIVNAEKTLENERLRLLFQSRLSEAAQELKNVAFLPGCEEAAVQQATQRLRSIMESTEEVGHYERDLSAGEEALRKVADHNAAIAELRAAAAEAATIDNSTELPVLMTIRRRMLAAVERAQAAEVAEATISGAEKDRRRLHNAIEDRKGALRTFGRVRPMDEAEVAAGKQAVLRSKSTFELEVCETRQDSRRQSFFFDGCWSPGTQAELFEDTLDLVQSAVDGYNVTIFAYGQTGAGKTYTMYGGCKAEEQGICPRAAEELFRIIATRQSRWDFQVRLSMLELYLGKLNDLQDSSSEKSLKIRTDQRGETYVENAVEEVVASADELRRMVDRGLKVRRSRDTQMNIGSSRSHVVLCVRVASVNHVTGQSFVGKLLLVDLAGSERVRRSGVEGQGLKEACEINSSLSALGDVIQALVRKDVHVPYRNHELTQLMQDSLGGTAKTLMIVNLSPSPANYEETLMTLKFSQRAKTVVNEPQDRRRVSAAKFPPRKVSAGGVTAFGQQV